MSSSESQRKFLIVRLSALGDTVCSLPAAVALKQTFPDCHITWAVDPRFAAIPKLCSSVDEVLPLKPSFSKLPTFEQSYDVAFDLQGLLKSSICVARAKAKQKLGYHWQREGAAFFSSRVLPDKSSIHVVDQYVDVVRAAGAVMESAQFNLVPTEEVTSSIAEKLDTEGVCGEYVVMNAGAGWATKRWPAKAFADLADRVSNLGITPVFIGGKAQSDIDAFQEVTASCQTRPINMLGKTSIGELVALIKSATVHVGGDTGSTHIAAAVSTPAVGLYSITRPERSCPYGQISNCHYSAKSLADIAPEAVFETVKRLIR